MHRLARPRQVHRWKRLVSGVRVVLRVDSVQLPQQVLSPSQREGGNLLSRTFLSTADHDDRVVPSHTFKFTAALQTAQGCDKPILVQVQTQGSHGYLPTDKRIAELADQWAFAAHNMGMRLTAVP